ncbi:hypothetical protein [Haloferax denitrificans]|uniref:Uncharacterized protein n=1 Tax=Haloferax denitrificans ATCC 35960 TaxID=662478 RepID=M0J5L1_9EURY|nr:hypothetical protein [Haloferax denitrificans]EMA03628.1 hypothetical protein C438_13419 [Haloferax denitrificans ATCC 35960]
MKLELELSTREQYIIALSLSVGIVAGLWFGILMIPPRALDVPMRFLDDGAVAASYYPVTNTHLFVSAALPLATAYLVRNHARDDSDELTPDRSDGDGDGRDCAHDLDGSSTPEFGPHPLDGGDSA